MQQVMCREMKGVTLAMLLPLKAHPESPGLLLCWPGLLAWLAGLANKMDMVRRHSGLWGEQLTA